MNLEGHFKGRAMIVTGGGSGIGKAIATKLARLGASVMLASRKLENLEAAVAEIQREGGVASAVPVDVRNVEQVQEMVAKTVERFGRVDGLINSAAGNFVCPAEELSPNGWNAVISIVLNGTFYCTQAVAQQLIKQGSGGSVVNIVTTYAWHGHPGTVHSAASKAGVVTMTRTLAVEWARYGIRLNCIAPGPTETDGAGAALWPTPEDHRRIVDTVPLGRFAQPAEIADSAAFLLSDHAAYITGEVLAVDGGQWLGKQIYGPAIFK